MNQLEYVTAAATVVSAVSLILITIEVRKIRSRLFQDFPGGDPCCRVRDFEAPGGYSIHVYRGGQWVLDADLSRPGYEAAPPSIEGSYEGQVVKKESLPRQSQ